MSNAGDTDNDTGVCSDNPDLTLREHRILIRNFVECPYCGTSKEVSS